MTSPGQVTQLDVLQVAWMSENALEERSTLVLTLGTQTWQPLGKPFANEQQAFADLSEVYWGTDSVVLSTLQRWNGPLHWIPSLLAWYRKENYARIERFVQGDPNSPIFSTVTCTVEGLEPVLTIVATSANVNVPSIATDLATATLSIQVARATKAPPATYTVTNKGGLYPVAIQTLLFPALRDLGMANVVVDTVNAWWIPERTLTRRFVQESKSTTATK